VLVDYEVDPYEKDLFGNTCLDRLRKGRKEAENYILFRNGNIKPAKRD
jgi:hypothetical protein